MYGQGRNDQGNYLYLCHTRKPQYKFGRPVFQSWGSTISIPLFHHSALVQVRVSTMISPSTVLVLPV